MIMEQKIYVREGRCFKQLPNHVGEYYNSDCTFTKERTQSSIGMCVLQEGTTCTIAEFKIGKDLSWYEAIEIAKRTGRHLPTQKEVVALIGHEEFKHNNYEWLQTEYSSSTAWSWRWYSSYSFAGFGLSSKSGGLQSLCARLFFDTTIKL